MYASNATLPLVQRARRLAAHLPLPPRPRVGSETFNLAACNWPSREQKDKEVIRSGYGDEVEWATRKSSGCMRGTERSKEIKSKQAQEAKSETNGESNMAQALRAGDSPVRGVAKERGGEYAVHRRKSGIQNTHRDINGEERLGVVEVPFQRVGHDLWARTPVVNVVSTCARSDHHERVGSSKKLVKRGTHQLTRDRDLFLGA